MTNLVVEMSLNVLDGEPRLAKAELESGNIYKSGVPRNR